MNLSDIITKCYILALIIRDDGERLLLGDGTYEFKSSLQHFAPNIYQNDIVELQGTDGQLLAGQVRRSAIQAFDGYIADGTIAKTTTEQSRRRFLAFFRKKHHYKVVYIMPDGTAVKRDRGYIVDAPAVQELYQLFPEYHIGLNFEDPNYYEYEEDSEGDEIYAHIQAIAITRELQAGLIWDALGAVSDDIAWSDYTTKNTTEGYAQITDAIATAPLSLTHLYGNAEQKTMAGTNLFNTLNKIAETDAVNLVIYDNNNIKMTNSGTGPWKGCQFQISGLKANTNYSLCYTQTNTNTSMHNWAWVKGADDGTVFVNTAYTSGSKVTFNTGSNTSINIQLYVQTGAPTVANNTATISNIQLNEGSTLETYEDFCGGMPSPNPEFPQAVNTVTGRQVIKITGKNLFDTSLLGSGHIQGINYDATANGLVISGTEPYNYPTWIIYGNGEIKKSNWWATVSDINTSKGQFLGSAPYTVSARITGGETALEKMRLFVGYMDGSLGQQTLPIGSTSVSINATKPINFVAFGVGNNVTYDHTIQIQCELGSTATAFEPYQGQSQEINLGSLELAKIGTYQDYIWNDNGTWKIHKAVGKVVLDGTETGWNAGNNGFLMSYSATSPFYGMALGQPSYESLCDHFTVQPNGTTWVGRGKCGFNSSGVFWCMHTDTTITTAADFKTWLGSNNTTLYIPLATPTVTEITDSELIEQLNHIYSLYQGQNNLWLIPSAGAQGEMTVRYAIGYSDIGSGYHWNEEQGTSSNIVTNDGIDSVRPLWIINGPATNPTLTNSTTGQTITWNGTVPADATLIIDMDRQTATLNGANVFAQLEGDWIELAVGPNKLQYSASGGATADSTIEWNGVIG